VPVLNKLRRRYRTARIDWLITPANAELIRHHPALDNVIEFARHEWTQTWRPGWSAVRGVMNLAAALRSARYDLVIDLHGQFRSAFFTLATGAPVRIGFDRPRRAVWRASDRTLPALARRHAWS